MREHNQLTFNDSPVESRTKLYLTQPENFMKSSSGITLKAVASLAIAAFSILNLQAQAAPRAMRVTAIAGDVQYARGGSSFVPIAMGARVGKGDVIKTGPGSHADIQTGDNTGQIQIAPQSTLAIDEATVTRTDADTLTDTQLSLNAGAMYGRVNRLSKGSRFEVATPKGIVGIRGSTSTFSLTADGQLTIVEGEGAIAFGTNDVVVVKAGETVGPNDRPAHPAPEQWLADISSALRDALTHGLGKELKPFIPAVEPFISPTLPGK